MSLYLNITKKQKYYILLSSNIIASLYFYKKTHFFLGLTCGIVINKILKYD